METEPQLYRSRFLMLGLFVLYSMTNAFQWIEYAIITSTVSTYYGVGEFAINWTSMVYMALYVPLILPANWLLEKKGLRFAVLVGSAGTCLGSWIKCGSLRPDLFTVSLLGQTVVAASQVFILGIPSHLAGVWFSAEEVSRACAAGVFGNQLGIALGFVLPPIIVPNSPNQDDVGRGLGRLFYGMAGVTTALFLAICILFRERPPHPPSRAQAAAMAGGRGTYWSSVGKLIRNRQYMLLLVTYGMNVGVFYAISTLLNQMVLAHYPGAEESAGWMGLSIVVAGMLGSVVCGVVLDKTHKFKETTLAVYVCTFGGMVAYAVVLRYGTIGYLFAVASFLGFFMTGYLPLGFEFAAELTYPEAESISSGFLNASAQVFGILFTAGAGVILENYGDWVANISLAVSLFLGSILTALIRADLRRLQASREPESRSINENSKSQSAEITLY